MPFYEVEYTVTRTEYYRVIADNPEHAKEIAFDEGEEEGNAGQTSDTVAGEVTELTDMALLGVREAKQKERERDLAGEYDTYFTAMEQANRLPLSMAEWMAAKDAA